MPRTQQRGLSIYVLYTVVLEFYMWISEIATAGPIVFPAFNTISNVMERTVNYYLILSSDYHVLNRIWDYCCYSGRDIAMYKTRLSVSEVGWVVELDDSKVRTAFLLNFSEHVTCVGRPYYEF